MITTITVHQFPPPCHYIHTICTKHTHTCTESSHAPHPLTHTSLNNHHNPQNTPGEILPIPPGATAVFGPLEAGAPGYLLVHWEAGGPQGVAQWVLLSRACAALWQLQHLLAGRTPPPTLDPTTSGALPAIRTSSTPTTTPTAPGVGCSQRVQLLLHELELMAGFVGLLGDADPTTLQEYVQEGMRVPVPGSAGGSMDLLDVVGGGLEVAAHVQPPPLSTTAALLNLARACTSVLPGRAASVVLQGPLLAAGPAALFGRPLGRGQDAGVVAGWGGVLQAEQRVGEYGVTLASLALLRAAAMRGVLTNASVGVHCCRLVVVVGWLLFA